MWNTIKYTNIRVIEVPEEKREKEKIFKEIMVENIPNLLKTTNLYIQEVQQIPQRDPQIDTYSKRAESQIQGENLESDQKKKKKKHSPLVRNPIRLAIYFLSETVEARKQWDNIFKVQRKKNLSIKNLISSKAIFKKWRQNKDIIGLKKWESLFLAHTP